jgi:L-ascorbate metabolism protein UlaG (beta-lactamase superfamily)
MIKIKWLGINGFEFSFNGKTILLDPYVTRNSKAVCKPSSVSKYISKADYIFIGHSHWDHLADTAEIIRQTGAKVIGSQTTANICRTQKVQEDKITEVSAGDVIKYSDFNVDFLESRHKEPCLYQGYYKTVPDKISRVEDFIEGGTMALRFNFGNIKILNIGSANFVEKALRCIDCDLLLVGISGRSDSFIHDLLKCIKPKIVIPTHFDYFETPMESPGIRVDLDIFLKEVNEAAPGIKVLRPEILKELIFMT